MLVWVVYDISKDKTRTKIAKRCLDFGLTRVQKSVYAGYLVASRVREILLGVEAADTDVALSYDQVNAVRPSRRGRIALLFWRAVVRLGQC